MAEEYRPHRAGSLTAAALLLGLSAAAVSTGSTSRAETTGPHQSAQPPSADGHAPAPARKRRPAHGTGLYTLDWGDLDKTRTRALDYIVMEPWEYRHIPEMKKRNPRLKVLMYKNLSATRKDSHESGMYSTGVSYAEANRNGWLQRDDSGRPIEWSDWPDLFPADVADRGYQQRWLKNVRRDLARGRWDGVMLDDALTRLSHSTVGNHTADGYRTDAAMRKATGSFLARVGPALKRDGHRVFPNLTDFGHDTWRGVVSSWRRFITGWQNEFFVKWGHDRDAPLFDVQDDWQWKHEMAGWAAKRRVPLLAITYSNRNDRRTQVYHRATWLLSWNGRTGASMFTPAEDHVNHNVRLASVYVGKPAEAEKVSARGIHTRRYRDGMVLVNPTRRSATVDAGPGYRRVDGPRVRHVRLPPHTGALLTRAR